MSENYPQTDPPEPDLTGIVVTKYSRDFWTLYHGYGNFIGNLTRLDGHWPKFVTPNYSRRYSLNEVRFIQENMEKFMLEGDYSF